MTDEQRNKVIAEIREGGIGKVVSKELLEMFQVKSLAERQIPTRDGETHIFIYHPEHSEGKTPPLFVNIHGGGFVKGHRQQDIVFCKNICSRAGCVVIDIDYTTAPEQKYPYALHQCYDVVKWAAENHQELGIDPHRLVLAGHSAGGNLVAGIALLNNQNKDFTIALQIIDYAALDLYTPPQFKKNAYKVLRLPPEKMQLYNELYIDDNLRLQPTASPVFAPAEMLTGLPQALIITAGIDPLCEEGEKYACHLIEAGVTVTARRFRESSHGFVVQRKGEFEEAEKLIFNLLKTVFAG